MRRDHRQVDGELLGVSVHDQVDELLGVGFGVVGQDTRRESPRTAIAEPGGDVSQRTDQRPAYGT